MKKEIEFGDYISKTYRGVEVFARVVTTIKPFVLVPYTSKMDIGKGIGCNILGNEKELSKWNVCSPPHYITISYNYTTDEAYDGNDFKASNIDEQVFMPKTEVSVSERIELANKLKELGVVNIDKRIYKHNKKL